jgi:hypothetical protein
LICAAIFFCNLDILEFISNNSGECWQPDYSTKKIKNEKILVDKIKKEV